VNICFNFFKTNYFITLQEQLKIIFNIHLTPSELGAIMSYFDKEHTGSINCSEFLMYFFRLGIDERNRRSMLWRTKDEKRLAQKKKELFDKQNANEKSFTLKLQCNFTDEDFKSGISKLTEAAVAYDRSNSNDIGIGEFERQSLSPYLFRVIPYYIYIIYISSINSHNNLYITI
jgi:uncharacterized protein (DUF2344 family)